MQIQTKHLFVKQWGVNFALIIIVIMLQVLRDYEDKPVTQVPTVIQDHEDPREIQDLLDQKAMQVTTQSDYFTKRKKNDAGKISA